MFELKFLTLSNTHPFVLLARPDTPLRVIQDAVVAEAQRMYGHHAANLLSTIDSMLEAEKFNGQFLKEEHFEGVNVDVLLEEVKCLGFEIQLKECGILGYLEGVLFRIFDTYAKKDTEIKSNVYDSKDNRVEILDGVLSFDGMYAAEVILKMTMNVNPMLEDIRSDLPELSKILDKLDFFNFVKSEMKQALKNHEGVKMIVSEVQSIKYL